MMKPEEQYRINCETMRKIYIAVVKEQRARGLMTALSGVFHGNRIAEHQWNRKEKEAWMDETKRSPM